MIEQANTYATKTDKLGNGQETFAPLRLVREACLLLRNRATRAPHRSPATCRHKMATGLEDVTDALQPAIAAIELRQTHKVAQLDPTPTEFGSDAGACSFPEFKKLAKESYGVDR